MSFPVKGRKAGEEYLLPGFHAYDYWLQYQTFDVTDLLTIGRKTPFPQHWETAGIKDVSASNQKYATGMEILSSFCASWR